MTIEQFKQELQKMDFHKDSTSQCKDMLVNLAFHFPVNADKDIWVPLRTAVCFFPDKHFEVHFATFENKRHKWGTWNSNLRNAPNAAIVLVHAINDVRKKYKVILSPEEIFNN